MKSLSTFACAWDNFSDLRSGYVKGQSVELETNLAATLKTIEQMAKDIKENIDNITSLKIDHSQPALVLRNLMCAIVNLADKVLDTYLLANLKRRITQQSNLAKKLFIRQNYEMFEPFCENSNDLSWESINSDLADSYESNVKYKEVPVDELSTVSQMLEVNICIDLKELDVDISIEKLRMIVKLMPVFFICNKNISHLINLHEFVYAPGFFEAIFLKKDYLEVQNEADQNCIEYNIGKEPNNDINIKNKVGSLL